MVWRKKKPVNKAQEEALYLLMEECGELIQACSKVLRHGLESFNPAELHGPNNSDNLHKETGDVMAAVHILQEEGVLDKNIVRLRKHDKMRSVKQYLRHAMRSWTYV